MELAWNWQHHQFFFLKRNRHQHLTVELILLRASNDTNKIVKQVILMSPSTRLGNNSGFILRHSTSNDGAMIENFSNNIELN